jgi:hypothetical protein
MNAQFKKGTQYHCFYGGTVETVKVTRTYVYLGFIEDGRIPQSKVFRLTRDGMSNSLQRGTYLPL